MNTNDTPHPSIFQFGIRHALAYTSLFAVVFYIAQPQYPSASTISLQRAFEQISANNIESASYYRGYDTIYLTTKVRIYDRDNKFVCVMDPNSQLARKLKTAGIPNLAQESPPVRVAILGFGTGVIVLSAILHLTIGRYRRNHAVHRSTACNVIEVENQTSVLGDG